MRIPIVILLLYISTTMINRPAIATDQAGGPARCAQCGCHTACLQTTCHVVCAVKKETKTCWCVERQEICPLMPGGLHRCDECPPPPRCGHPKCVKKLIKKEYQVDVPVYQCVVRYLCGDCRKGRPAAVPSDAVPRVVPSPSAPPAAPAMATPPPAPMPQRNPRS
jgi:hypothetical protein